MCREIPSVSAIDTSQPLSKMQRTISNSCVVSPSDAAMDRHSSVDISELAAIAPEARQPESLVSAIIASPFMPPADIVGLERNTPNLPATPMVLRTARKKMPASIASSATCARCAQEKWGSSRAVGEDLLLTACSTC